MKNAEHPIKNLKDLAKSTYEVGVLYSSSVYETFESSQYETHIASKVDSGSTHAAFKKSSYDPHQQIWRRMQATDSFPQNASQGVQWVRDREEFVFIMDGPTLRHIANQPPCDLKTGS